MSETDSENDYESAGEDTEDSVSKSEERDIPTNGTKDVNAEKNDINEKTEEDAEKNVKSKEVVKNEHSLKSSPQSETVNSECKEKESSASKVSEPVASNESEAGVSKASEPGVSKASEPSIAKASEPSIAKASEPSIAKASEPSIAKVVSETEQTTNQVIDTQPRRVTLRLEKKLQERNRQASLPDDKKEPPKPEEKAAISWGFGSWGSSLLSTAASSVTTFTSQVTQGIGSVLETVETTLGAPPPEELATILKEKREKEGTENQVEEENKITDKDENETKEATNENGESTTPASTIFTGVTSLTKVVGNTGSKVIMGGLDTLELIGKKTMDIITERDPGLRSARSTISSGMTLSYMLREAKEKAEEDQKNLFEDPDETVHYSQMFDEHNGLVHLEALEMLSNQNDLELQRAMMKVTDDSQKKCVIDEIARICDIQPSDELPSATEIQQDFDESVLEDLEPEQLSITFEKIRMVRDVAHTWVDDCLEQQAKGERIDAKEIHRQAITNLAYFTAKCIEQFHKFGELVMVIQNVSESDTLTSAKNLIRLTTMLSGEVNIVAAKYCQCLNTAADDSADPDSVTPLITSVYLEASNSTTCIHDALQLLVPVLQMTLL